VSAPAEADGGPSGQAERLAFDVADFEIAFDPNGPIAVDSDLSWHSLDAIR
jgi:hypothetical protein